MSVIMLLFLIFEIGTSFRINEHLDIDFTPHMIHPDDSLKIDVPSELLLKNRCGKAQKRPTSHHIIGGVEASLRESHEFLWAVAIFTDEHKKAWCTGTLIGPNQVLTAAHCLLDQNDDTGPYFNGKDYHVVAGAHCVTEDEECMEMNSTRVMVKVANAVVPGEMFKGDGERRGGDIAILILEHPIHEDDRIAYACLASKDLDLPYEKPNFIFWGWGRNDIINNSQPSILNYLANASLFDCRRAKNVKDFDLLCLNADSQNKGMGKGDSGSGLEYVEVNSIHGDHLIVGVSAYQNKENIQENFVTDVRLYAKWICEQIGICYML